MPSLVVDSVPWKAIPRKDARRRSLKDECVFLNAIGTGSEARAGIGSWTDYYNRRRPPATFDGRTPDEVYATAEMTERLAA